MKKCFFKSLAITIAMFVGSSAFGQDYYDDCDTEVETVSFLGGCDAEVETVSLLGGCDAGMACDDGKGCFDACYDCGPSVYAAVEVPWLQINESAITSQFLDALINGLPPNNVAGFGIPPAYGQEPSFRVYGGVENCNGFGIRGAYWQFEDSARSNIDTFIPVNDFVIDSLSLGSSHEFKVADIEFSQRAEFCGWNLMMTTGVRFARFEQVHTLSGTGFDINTPNPTGALAVGIGRKFEGAGLTASIGWEREIRCSGFGFYGNLRGSVLFGDTDYNAFARPTGAANNPSFPNFDVDFAKVKDQPVVVTEIQLGAQYERCTNYGVVFVRAGVEGQVWELAPVALGLLDENIGLFGPTFTIGLSR